MGKILLSRDYDKIILETFKIPEKDFNKYYSNIINKHCESNNDIIQELENAINRWINWYKSKIKYDPVWEVDSQGNKKILNPEETYISLIAEFGIQRDINRSFFDEQLRIVKLLKSKIGLNIFKISRDDAKGHKSEIYNRKYTFDPEILGADQKLEIALKLIGENPYNTIQPVYHHIPGVLKKYNLSPLEAANILSDLRGAFSPKENDNVIKKIIEYLKEKNSLSDNVLSGKKNKFNRQVNRYVIKYFPEYLLHNERNLLADRLKKEFSTEIGKGIRLLIKALEERKILNVDNRQFKAIYESIKYFFERDIGTYQSVHDFQYIEEKHRPDYDSILQKLDYILNQLKND